MSRAHKLETGQQFGYWTVVREDGLQGSAKMFLVECKCGEQKRVRAAVLVSGKSQGCLQCRNPKRIDRTGQKFQRWTVVSFAETRYSGKDNQPKAYWNCVCECGTERIIEGNLLAQKGTTSCGCHKKEGPLYECRKHELWGVYRGIRDRCYYPKHMHYDRYGGRGIEMSEEFREPPEGFWNFVEYMGSKPYPEATVDRIDPDRNYERGNLRWADRLTQGINKSYSTHGHRGHRIDGVQVTPPSPTYKAFAYICGRYIGRDMVCARWIRSKGGGFNNFLEDMGIRPENSTLTRIDKDLPYSKDNCYWSL